MNAILRTPPRPLDQRGRPLHDLRLSVIEACNFRCGYCGVSETSSGGELTIDHYRPVSQNGDDSDDNLVYAC